MTPILNGSIEKLVSISSGSISETPSVRFARESALKGRGFDELEELLRLKNGFYAFESALHVFPTGCYPRAIDVEFWNEPKTWKDQYNGCLDQVLFFAEDLFGEQFGISDDQVIRFDPETGTLMSYSSGLEEWAGKILNDYELETGYELASQWQKLHGPIPVGFRLLPVTPFFLGGNFEVDNLYLIDSVEAMTYRADMWKQTKDLPDGSEIELRISE